MSDEDIVTHYDVLQLKETATAEEIKRAADAPSGHRGMQKLPLCS